MSMLKVALAVVLGGSSLVYGQQVEVTVRPLTDSDIQLLRSDVQADKIQIIGHTMQLTDAESSGFWPVYKEYANEQHAIADKRLALIKDYAQNYDSLDNAKASTMTTTLFQIEDETQALRKSYFPKFEKVLGAKRAAKFYQVDARLTLMVNLQLASIIPIIP